MKLSKQVFALCQLAFMPLDVLSAACPVLFILVVYQVRSVLITCMILCADSTCNLYAGNRMSAGLACELLSKRFMLEVPQRAACTHKRHDAWPRV